jgi:uncharacterized membrane protein
MPTFLELEARETGRLIALSDGVIAIAITLLVLEITVPEIPPGTPLSIVPGLVAEQWPEFFGYVLSFLTIGMYWVLHRRVFAQIEAHDRRLLWLNLVFLLFVAFVPYATSMFATYPDEFGVSFYAGTLALTGFSLGFCWLYAARKSLVKEGLGSRVLQLQVARYFTSPLVFVLSIFIATVDPSWAIISWVVLLGPLNLAIESQLDSTVLGEGDDVAA